MNGAWPARVEAAIADLSPGEVVSYGEVARRAGRPKAARSVGTVLAQHDGSLPWWRVVRADGRIVAHKAQEQARRLRAEGVEVRNGRVVDAMPDR
ncbi:MAG: MGMT family protein [Actinomycetota bacterium]|nr:MGMT family protein [Actinomycetota bacterium]